MTRRAVVAGMFYPFGKDSLQQTVSELSQGIEEKNFSCVVSPHAGYQYSGKTAAHAITSLKPAKTFVILGPNHNSLGKEFAITEADEWETPLGKVKIDKDLAKELRKCEFLEEDDLAHMQEHSIEVQLPFLQHRFKNFEIVPISIGEFGYSENFLKKCEILGKHIAKTMKSTRISVIASSDFSHYLPREMANEKDSKVIEHIKRLDAKGFLKTLEKTDASICGYGPITVIICMAKELGMKSVEVIHHSDSGEETGDESSVVSYYALGFR